MHGDWRIEGCWSLLVIMLLPPPTFASFMDLMTVLAEVGRVAGTLECFWMTAFMAIALTMQFQDSWLLVPLLKPLVGVRWLDSRTGSAIQRFKLQGEG